MVTNAMVGTSIVAVGGALILAAANGITPLYVTNRLIELSQHTIYGPPLYIAAFATLPVLLFPSTFLAIAGGLLFGATKGVIYTIIGSNLSAFFAYRIRQRLRRIGAQEATEQSPNVHWRRIEPFIKRRQDNPFPTVLTMHCLFLPYEFVSYGAGLLGLPTHSFVPATAIGILPWTFSLYNLTRFKRLCPEPVPGPARRNVSPITAVVSLL